MKKGKTRPGNFGKFLREHGVSNDTIKSLQWHGIASLDSLVEDFSESVFQDWKIDYPQVTVLKKLSDVKPLKK